MPTDPQSEPDPEPTPDTEENDEENGDPDLRMARVKKVARKIEKRVRKTLTDFDRDTPSGGTEVSPSPPQQP